MIFNKIYIISEEDEYSQKIYRLFSSLYSDKIELLSMNALSEIDENETFIFAIIDDKYENINALLNLGYSNPLVLLVKDGLYASYDPLYNNGALFVLSLKETIIDVLPSISSSLISDWKYTKSLKVTADAFIKQGNDYFEIIENLPELVFEINVEGYITYVNKKIVDLLQYSKEEIIGQKIEYLICRDDIHAAQDGFRKTLNGKHYKAREFRLIKKDGTLLNVHIYTSPLFKNDEIAGLRGIAADISELVKVESDLHINEEKFRSMIENSSEVIAIINLNGAIEYQSLSTSKLLGFSSDEMNGLNIFDLVLPEDRDFVIDSLSQSVTNNLDNQVIQFRSKTKKGKTLYLELTCTNMISNPAVKGIVLNIRDITDRKKIEDGLRRSESKYKKLYQNAMVGMASVDYDTSCIISHNDKCQELFEIEFKKDLLGSTLREYFKRGEDYDVLTTDLYHTDSLTNYELELVTIKNASVWVSISGNYDKEKNTIELIFLDITKRKEVEQTVHDLTFYDRLTNLPNKELFENFVQTEIMKLANNNENIFAIMCIGLDRFKNINNIYGPRVGDELLIKISNLLEETVYKKDDKISRFDGDKFLILFSNIESRENAGAIVNNIKNIFHNGININNIKIDITCSIGVSLYPIDGTSSETLINNSEAAMYMAKDVGRDSYTFYDEELNSEMLKRFQLENDLRKAILNDEFVVFYQPKVNSDGAIEGMESLIRWKSPSKGLIPPFVFIPLVERNGMIKDLGQTVLQKSCDANKDWQNKGYSPLIVAVNLSPFQFQQHDLIANIENVIKNSSLDSRWLELEITESGIMENERDALEKLHELKRMGFSIAIDDFGTGYSSLSKLQDYPIDTLKIDKSFIDNILTNQKTAAISKHIINLSHDLGFKVVAEGVETKEQLDFLIDNGCDQFQGYYFSKPLPEHEFEQKLDIKTIVN